MDNVTMAEAVAVIDNMLLEEQARLLCECRLAIDQLLEQKPMLKAFPYHYQHGQGAGESLGNHEVKHCQCGYDDVCEFAREAERLRAEITEKQIHILKLEYIIGRNQNDRL